MIAKGLLVHVLVFAGASVLALRSWTAPDEPKERHSGTELWSGRPGAVESVKYTDDKVSFNLQPKKDDLGTYFVGTVQEMDEPSPVQAEPVGASADAGASPVSTPPAPAKPPERFISATKGQELVDSLASLRATRVLGKLEGERLAEYGLEGEGKGQLVVSLSGSDHKLIFGDKTPGGRDRYVLDPATSRGYVIEGNIANDVISAENRLVERDFHSFDDSEVAMVKISSGEASREVVRHPTKKNFWANADSSESKDETVSNWMTKVDRLRVTKYLEEMEPPIADSDRVVRVEYFNEGGRSLGFLEIVRQPPASPGGKPRYAARSELSRWYATVLRSTAEQVDQDLGSVLTK